MSSRDPVRLVLDRLVAMGKTLKHVNGQEMAQCPGHDDAPDGPSLAIREGEDGAILHCHAGCRTEDVVRAMSLSMRDLFSSPAKQSGSLNMAGIPRSRSAFRGDTASSFAGHFPGVSDGIVAPSVGKREGGGPPALTQPKDRLDFDFADSPGGDTANLGALASQASEGADIVTLRPAPLSSLTWVADYIYRDAGGAPAYKVTRYAKASGGKAFFQFRRDPSGAGWSAGLNGKQPPLYRLPEVLAAVAAGDPVLVVEGEKDADRAAGEGAVATTAPMGAGKWRPEHTAALAGANVIIVADDDDPGRAHASAVYAALYGVAKAVQVFLPAQGCKDLSEHLDAGNDLFALRPFGPQELAVDEPARRVVLTSADKITMGRVRWGWKDRMPIGELTLIPGREGVGKSLLLAWLAAQLTRGTLPGEFYGEPRAVLYAASEDSWRYTIAPRMVAAGVDRTLIHRVEVEDAQDDRLILPADVGLVAEAAIGVKAAALMLDPIISLIDDRLSVNQARELRRALEPLRRAAEQAQIMVLALAHFNKTADVDTLSKIPGARAWAEVARAAFGVAEDADQGCYVASQIKNNLGRLNLPNLAYRVESAIVDTEDGPTDVGRLVWTGESDAGIDEVLSRRPVRQAREVSETTKGLVEYIEQCGYPMPLTDVYEHFPEVKRETVRQTLKRAADRGTLSNPVHGHYGPKGGG